MSNIVQLYADDTKSDAVSDQIVRTFDPIADEGLIPFLKDYFRHPVTDLVSGKNKQHLRHYNRFPPIYYCRLSKQISNLVDDDKLLHRTPHCMAVVQMIMGGWVWQDFVSYEDMYRLFVENGETHSSEEIAINRKKMGRHQKGTFGGVPLDTHINELLKLKLIHRQYDPEKKESYVPTRLTIYRYLETSLNIAMDLQSLLLENEAFCNRVLSNREWFSSTPGRLNKADKHKAAQISVLFEPSN